MVIGIIDRFFPTAKARECAITGDGAGKERDEETGERWLGGGQMKWKILAIGKPALGYAKAGVEEYRKRIRRYTPVEISFFKESGQDKNSRRLLEASEKCFRIVLDERGQSLTTAVLARRLEQWDLDRIKTAAVLVGGADGHSDEVRKAADLVLGLSSLTLQHELALVVWLEQLYRVCTLRRGEPYHR